jgi:uncharacterized protein with LGFP repeats
VTAIDDKWHQIPWVGNPKDEGAGSEEMPTADGRGRQRDFDNATIVWSPQTGAHEVHGDIRVKWAMNGWLGFPLTDETGTPDGIGRYNHFENGSIYWTAELGAYVVHGAIRDLWASEGWERGVAGYPRSDEFNDPSAPGGRQSLFQRGVIRWSPASGASFHAGVPID